RTAARPISSSKASSISSARLGKPALANLNCTNLTERRATAANTSSTVCRTKILAKRPSFMRSNAIVKLLHRFLLPLDAAHQLKLRARPVEVVKRPVHPEIAVPTQEIGEKADPDRKGDELAGKRDQRSFVLGQKASRPLQV